MNGKKTILKLKRELVRLPEGIGRPHVRYRFVREAKGSEEVNGDAFSQKKDGSRKTGRKWRMSILIPAILAALLGFFSYSAFGPSVEAPEKGLAVYVPTGTSPQQLKEMLRPHLRNRLFLSIMIDLAVRSKGEVHAGKFILGPGQSTYSAVKAFFVGRGVQVGVRFNSLPSLEALAGAVSGQLEADSLSLLDAFRNDPALDSWGMDSLSVMGLFVPNTYYFYWDTPAQDFFRRMVDEHKKFWDGARTEKALAMGLTPLQVSTLASIVQAETAKPDERAEVAGLYVNRLKRGMRLQSDPTVIYAMRLEGQQDPVKRVYFKNLKIKSPFNTYLNKGLPPSPINIPEISSVDAVLNHKDNDYLYMCASVERFGYHEFAATMNDHQKNRRKYIAWLNEKNIK